MSQVNETQNLAPNVQDKRKPAPGVLPKNAQTWVVMGLTTVIMLMLWVSGPAKGAKSSQKPDGAKTETVVGLSPAEIASRLEQERRDQQTPLTPAQRPFGQQPVDAPSRAIANQGSAPPAEQDPIKQDLRRREYMARFASNVSLSYRPPQAADPTRRLRTRQRNWRWICPQLSPRALPRVFLALAYRKHRNHLSPP